MKKITSITALLLAVLLLGGIFCGSTAYAEEDVSAPLDYSDPSVTEKREFTPSELLSLIIGRPIGSAETEYLDSYSSHSMFITDSFSNDLISLSYSDSSLTVAAKSYSYTSQGGSLIKWIPKYAELNGVRTSVSHTGGDIYSCTINNVRKQEGVGVSIKYSCSISVPKDQANNIINLAFNKATEMSVLEKEYENILEEYLEGYRKYEQYLEDIESYSAKLEKYDEYLKLKAQYEKEHAAYLKYLADLSDYGKNLEKYNNYLAEYDKYLQDKAEYEKIYSENSSTIEDYINYYTALNNIRSSMYAIESLFIKPESGHGTLFQALQNKEMIALFEKYKYELKLYGVSIETIDRLSLFSDELNELLRSYSKERDKSEQAAFEFYCANYEEIRDKFNFLYDSMVDIMSPTLFNHVCVKIGLDYKDDPDRAEYMKHRTIMVLAQIYLVCRGLDDTKSAGGSWDFYNYSGKPYTYAFIELISQNVIITDTNTASPEGLSWPQEVPEFVMPPIPIEPEKVAEPLPPTAVDEPAPPTTVEEPVRPAEVKQPEDLPAELGEILECADIVEALNRGELSKREEFKSDVTFTVERDVKKLISFDNKPVMTVYGYDMSSPISEKIISSPADFSLPTTAPYRDADKRLSYTFAGWSVSQNELIAPTGDNAPDLSRDFCIYAIYSSEERIYNVTWVTASGKVTEGYTYGSIPEFKGDTAKAPTETKAYKFEGWTPTTRKVTRDVTYTAEYTESERKYSVNWVLPDRTITKSYSFEDTPTEPPINKTYISGGSLIDLLGWDKEISKITEDVTYTALYNKTVLVSSNSGMAQITSSPSTYYVTLPDSTLNAKGLISLAAAEDKRIEITADGVVILVDREAVKSLAALKGEVISVSNSTDIASVGECSLGITDGNGAAVNCDSDIRLNIPFTVSAAKNFHVYNVSPNGIKTETPFTYTDNMLTFAAKSNSSFAFKQLYSVTFAAVENGGTMMDKYIYEAGSALAPTFYPAAGYTVESIVITRADNGETTTIDSFNDFLMPPSDITVTVNFARPRYTVSFVWDGKVISSEKYTIGEMPTAPKMESEFERDGYRYVFAGWSSAILSVTKEATYIAKYNKFLIDSAPPADTGNAFDAFLNQTVLPIIAVVMLLTAGTLALVFFIRTKKKAKKIKKTR